MKRMTRNARPVTGGVDTHADVHMGVVVDSRTGHVLGTSSFETNPKGYKDLLRWMQRLGRLDKVGVEGTGCYGAGLTRHLTASGIDVVEVDRPDRKVRRLRGKSDPVDAEAAARAALSGTARGVPKQRDGAIESIRTFRMVYDSAQKSYQQALSQFQALVLTAPAKVRERYRRLPLRKQLELARRQACPRDEQSDIGQLRYALRQLARRAASLDGEKADLEERLRPLVAAASPDLVGLKGVGLHMAADLLIATGENCERLRSEAAFAHLCGVAPIPASSGKVTRHRLNRGGNRRANHALWRIAMVRMAHDERTKAYVRRRTGEGKSKLEIIRCLKRYIAREVYRALTNPVADLPTGRLLRELRTQTRLPLSTVAASIGTSPINLSKIERELVFDTALARQAQTFLVTHSQLLLAA